MSKHETISEILVAVANDFRNDPIVLIPVFAFVLGLWLGRRPAGSPPLSKFWSAVSYWYLINGCFIYTMLDGFVGGFQRFPTLHNEYCKLDFRYRDFDAMIMVLSRVEVFVYMPLSLVAYAGIRRRSPHGDIAGIAVSTLVAYGTVMFYGGELFHVSSGSEPHVPVDWALTFSAHHVFYFWIFFVAAGVLWSVVPVWLIVKHWAQLASAGAVSKLKQK